MLFHAISQWKRPQLMLTVICSTFLQIKVMQRKKSRHDSTIYMTRRRNIM